jgi:hypothetical protein
MTEAALNTTEVKFLPPEEVGEELSGWWILQLELEGCWDAIGPYDSKEEAARLANPAPQPCPQARHGDWCVWPRCDCTKETQ